jgi:5-methyltetrahydrofolate--homocysteine methyltransferase
MYGGMELLQPILIKSGVKAVGKVIIGTTKGDLHDIGKNLVAMMLKGGGFEVVDLGIDVSPEKFLKATQEYHPDIVGMSALLTTTMMGMKEVITILKKKGLRDKVKVMIGGAPINQEFADEIGADGYAPDVVSAVEKAKKFLKELRR